MKDVQRQASALPVPRDHTDASSNDPNVIPPEDRDLLGELGLTVGQRLKRGRYGVVYDGHFSDNFSVDSLTARRLHFLFVRPEQRESAGDMQPGHKFALKFMDIESRKAHHIEDVEQRVHQEINFMRRVTYGPATAVVRVYCILATTPSRFYALMELADDNLQCLIHAYQVAGQSGKLLPPQHVLALYGCLIAAVRSLHQQKLTYGMMRTSNILVFGQTTPPAEGQAVNADEAPFRVKIADFVRSLEMDAPGVSPVAVEDAIEEDLDDLFYVHSEVFSLTRFDFSQYQVFKESLKIMTDMNAQKDSMAIFDKVLDLINKFAREFK